MTRGFVADCILIARRFFMTDSNEVRAARRHLEAVLDEDPTHSDALDLLSSILQMQQDTEALQDRLLKPLSSRTMLFAGLALCSA